MPESSGPPSPGAARTPARAYDHDVAEFVAWAERGGCAEPQALDHRTLRRYLAYLDTRGFARSSIARKAAALRAYLRFLQRHGVIDQDPGRSLRAPKGAGRLPRVIRSDEADDLLDAASDGGARRHRRDGDDRRRCRRPRPRSRSRSCCATSRVLEVLYGAGLRVAECCGLRIADCDLDRGLVTVLGQGLQGPPGADRRAGRRRAPRVARDRAGPSSPPRRRRPTPSSSTGGVARSRPATPVASLDATPAARRPRPPPARAPPRVRYAPARRRCRPAGGPGAPRPRRPRDHPDLHPRDPRPAPCRLRSDPSPCLTIPARSTRRALDRLQVRRHAERARAPHPPLLAAGEVRRRPRRRRAAAEHRAGRPRELRDLRAHRRDRQVRSRPRLQVRDLRDLAHQGRDHRRAALDRLGAALGAGEGARDRAGVSRSSRTSCAAAPRTPRSRPSST